MDALLVSGICTLLEAKYTYPLSGLQGSFSQGGTLGTKKQAGCRHVIDSHIWVLVFSVIARPRSLNTSQSDLPGNLGESLAIFDRCILIGHVASCLLFVYAYVNNRVTTMTSLKMTHPGVRQ